MVKPSKQYYSRAWSAAIEQFADINNQRPAKGVLVNNSTLDGEFQRCPQVKKKEEAADIRADTTWYRCSHYWCYSGGYSVALVHPGRSVATPIFGPRGIICSTRVNYRLCITVGANGA
jgi:hypothetical protein